MTPSPSRLLESGQPVAEAHPCNIVAQPGMMAWRKSARLVEAASRDIYRRPLVFVLVGERRAARSAKGAPHRLRRAELRRLTFENCKMRFLERDPGNGWGAGDAPAGLAVADHAIGSFPLDPIPDEAATAPTLRDSDHKDPRLVLSKAAPHGCAPAHPMRALARPRSASLAVFTGFYRGPLGKQTRTGNVIHLQTDAVGILEQD